MDTSGEYAKFAGAGQGLGAAADVELAVEIIDMRFHRAGGDEEGGGDLLIAFAGGNVLEHLLLLLA